MGRKIAIVGNGVVGGGGAAVIDAADLVIRFNDCRSYGTGGTRTDIVAVCNTGRPARAMLTSREWRTHPGVVSAAQIWSVRDPVKFAALRMELALSHPELDDFCDDYTEGFEAFCAHAGKRHVVIDRRIHEALDAALSAANPPPYVVPSSGMVVIGAVLETWPDAEAVLAGFDHVGWEGHPFAAEKKIVDAHIAAGRLKRLAARPLVPCS